MIKHLTRVGLSGLWMITACTGMTAEPGYVIYWGIGGNPTKEPGQKSSGVLSPDGVPLSNAVAVAVGQYHGLVLRNDGTVFGSGGNRWGQATGTPSPWPGRSSGQVQINGKVLSNVVAIAAGRMHSLALKSDGLVTAWGVDDSPDRPMRLAAGLSNIVAIASGERWCVGANRSGNVFDLVTGQPIAGLSNIVSVAVQTQTNPMGVALTLDGTLETFGSKGFLDCENRPPAISNVISISCGQRFNLALSRTGSVYAWGYDTSYDASTGRSKGCWNTNPASFASGIAAVSAGDFFSLGIKNDGSIANWDMYGLGDEIPAELTSIVSIAVGQRFNLAITTNAAVAERFRH